MKPMNTRTVYPKTPLFTYDDWITYIKLCRRWTERNNKFKNQVG